MATTARPTPHAAAKTIDIALALNLEPCFTPVESPGSNGMAEAFVRTPKRDYVRVNPVPDAATALASPPGWIDDHNEVRPHEPPRLPLAPRVHRPNINPACPV